MSLLGKSGVGKTSFISKFINNKLPDDYDPDFDNRFKISKTFGKKEYLMEILDTKYDEENYRSIVDLWINFGEGFLLVFSINDYESFEFLKDIYKIILRFKNYRNCPILLVGNKLDLKNERVVRYSEAKELADSWEIEYCEISTRNDSDCQKILEKIIKKYIIIQKENQPYKGNPWMCCLVLLYFGLCCCLCGRI